MGSQFLHSVADLTLHTRAIASVVSIGILLIAVALLREKIVAGGWRWRRATLRVQRRRLAPILLTLLVLSGHERSAHPLVTGSILLLSMLLLINLLLGAATHFPLPHWSISPRCHRHSGAAGISTDRAPQYPLTASVFLLLVLVGVGSFLGWGWLPSSAAATSPVRSVLAANQDASLALKSDGTVWAWGSLGYGQRGCGDPCGATAEMPSQVVNLTGMTAVAAGAWHDLALKADGTVWAWGHNVYGQLGNGATTDSGTPVKVSGLGGITAIAAGKYHSLALKGDGTVWAWGHNGAGDLGTMTTQTCSSWEPCSMTPTQVTGLSGVVAIATHSQHNLVLKSDGTVWAWGLDDYGQVGVPGTQTCDTFNRPLCVTSPVQVGGVNGVIAVDAGPNDSSVLKADGTVWSWGGGTTTPSQVSGLSGIVAIDSPLALKSDGTIWWWSPWNIYGQFGNGTCDSLEHTSPTQVTSVTGVTAIATSGAHLLALTDAGIVRSWGGTNYGRPPPPATQSAPTVLATSLKPSRPTDLAA